MILGGLALVLVMARPELAAAQCAMCRTAFASAEGQQLVAAFRSGILFLLAAPFVAFGAVATLAVRAQRRRRSDSLVLPVGHRNTQLGEFTQPEDPNSRRRDEDARSVRITDDRYDCS